MGMGHGGGFGFKFLKLGFFWALHLEYFNLILCILIIKWYMIILIYKKIKNKILYQR